MINFNDYEHGKAIAKAAGCVLDKEHDTVISQFQDGELVCGVIYKGYTRESISMHVAVFNQRLPNRDMLWVCFDYPFTQLKCSKVLGHVKSSNQASLDFTYKLGFKYVTEVPGVFPDGDLIILSMGKGECRWLKIRPKTLQSGATNGQR